MVGSMGEFSEEVLLNKVAEDCLLPMGITSENVAKDFHISRKVQDEFEAKSFQKAAAANKAGKFKAEIVPIKAKVVDPKTNKEVETIVDQDDGIREGVTAEGLAKLKPAFAKDGSTHAGKPPFANSPITRFHRVVQVTLRKCLMALRQSFSPAARWQSALVSLSLANTSNPLSLAFHLASWVSAQHLPFLAFSNSLASLKMKSISSRLMRLSLARPSIRLNALEFLTSK